MTQAEGSPRDEDMEFYSRPQFERLSDGSWRAHYPASDWSVIGETRESAIEKLKLEHQRRVKEQPGYLAAEYNALRRHLIEPIPGVYAFTREEGERVRASQDPQAELERIANELDAAQSPPDRRP